MKYKSDILETIHENATANFKIGAISVDRMKEYDRICLVEEAKPVYDTGNSVEYERIPAPL